MAGVADLGFADGIARGSRGGEVGGRGLGVPDDGGECRRLAGGEDPAGPAGEGDAAD